MQIALASLLMGATLAMPKMEPLSKLTKRFIEQDAFYLITPEDRAHFRALATEEARRAFAEAFWRRRDPDPTTPENEFQEAYFERIDAANRRFADEGIPGWKTDRGRSFILYGLPDHIETQDSDSVEMESLRDRFQTGARTRPYYVSLDPISPGAPSTLGQEVWYYRHPKGGLVEYGGRLLFLKNARGRWVLSAGGGASPAAPLYRAPVASDLAPPPAPRESRAGFDFEVIERKTLDEMVLEGSFRAAIPTEAAVFYLPSASGHTLTTVAMRIDRKALSYPGVSPPKPSAKAAARATVHLFGAVLEGFGEKAQLLRSISTPVEVERREAPFGLVFSLELPPGRFQLYLAVLDIRSLKIGSLARPLDVPDFQGPAQLSTILLARHYRAKAPGTSLSVESGELDLGSFALAIEPRFCFGRSDTAEVFFEITRAQGPFEITYQISRDGVAAGPALRRRSATHNISQPLPLSAFSLATGSYRLAVQVKDEPTGQLLTGTAELSVER